ncbi:MAG: VanZ family protein [Clostridia bacterium]|nr:VanZ family protein [Clostridia bacterium]
MHRIEAYIRLALIFIVIISTLYLPILLYLRKKGKSVIRQISYIGLICSVFLIVFATILFVPITFHPQEYILNIKPFNWIGNIDSFQQVVVEKIPNIILFIPLGFFIPTVLKSKRKLYKVALISFVITFSVEFFQYFIGRSSDIDDIITNILGAIIGYVMFKVLNSLLKHKILWNKFVGNTFINEKKLK